MTFYERYDLLCQEQGFSGQSSTAFEKIGLKKGTVGDWKKNNSIPAAKYLIQLSRFFGVSIDYLVGETEIRNRAIKMDKDTAKLIDDFDECDDEGKQIVMAHAVEERRRTKEKTDTKKESVVS